MQCPNKNDNNWKILEKALGPIAAHGVFNNMGLPNIEASSYYKENFGKMPLQKLVTNSLISLQSGDVQVDDSPGLEIEKKEELRSYKVVESKKARLRAVNSQISSADKANDFAKVDKLTRQKAGLEEDIDELQRLDSIDSIIEHGQKDLEFLKSLTAKTDLTAEEIVAAQKVSRLWMGADQFLSEIEQDTLDEFLGELDKISKEAERQDLKLGEISKKNVEEFSKATLKTDFFRTIAKDIALLPKLLLDLSHIKDSGVLAMFKSIKLANSNARKEAVDIMEKLESMSNKLKKDYGGMNKVYDMLLQKYEDGGRTGNLITKINPEYEEEKFNRKAAYLKFRGKDEAAFFRARKEYFDFLENNEVMFDVRKLFGNKEGRDQHIAELKDLLNEEEYERRYKMIEKKIESYNERREAVEESYFEEYDQAVAMKMLSTWELENSPYEWANYKSNPADPRFKGIKPVGYKYTYSIPKNKSAYDSRFEALERDSDLMEYYNFMRDTMKTMTKILPEDEQRRMKNNAIPFVEKKISEIYNEKGYRHAADSIMASFKKSVLTKQQGSIFRKYQDPVTGETVDELAAPSMNDKDRVNELNRIKVLEFRKENDRAPSVKERNQMYRASQEEIAQTKSFDLNAVMGAYALQLKAYEHKSNIEGQMELIKRYVYELQEDLVKNGVTQKRPDGTKVVKGKDESFLKTKEVIGNHLDAVFYDKGQEDEMVGSKVRYTKEEEAEKTRLEELLKDENLSDGDRKMLEEKLNKLGGQLSGSKVLNNVLKYIQLKGMGFNVTSALTNFQFGAISNWTHAAGGEDFSFKNFRSAQRIAFSVLGGNKSDTGKKVKALMRRFDVLKDSTQEFGKTGLGKVEEFAYSPTKYTEFMNQAPLMIALLKENGQWENFNTEGEFTGDKAFDEDQFKVKLDQIVKSLHGNYDPDSPLLMKKHVLGRMASQFRTWMFESVNNRFQKGDYDQLLGRYKKGRYRSYADFNWKTSHLLLFPLVKDMYSLVSQDMSKVEGEERANVANMRKNLIELAMLGSLVALGLMAKSLADDDDEDEQFVMNFLLNNISRMQADITFYVNPMEAENLINHIIPATSVFHDGVKAVSSGIDLLMGEDEIEKGVFAGDSGSARAIGKLIPGVSQYYKTYSMMSQVYNIY